MCLMSVQQNCKARGIGRLLYDPSNLYFPIGNKSFPKQLSQSLVDILKAQSQEEVQDFLPLTTLESHIMMMNQTKTSLQPKNHAIGMKRMKRRSKQSKYLILLTTCSVRKNMNRQRMISYVYQTFQRCPNKARRKIAREHPQPCSKTTTGRCCLD